MGKQVLFRLELEWMGAISPNRARRGAISARSGHEAVDRELAKQKTLDWLSERKAMGEYIPNFIPKQFYGYKLELCYPTLMERDALNCHFMAKATLDGICEALGLDDAYLYPALLVRGEPVRGGKVIVEIYKAGWWDEVLRVAERLENL